APSVDDPIELLLACHDKIRRFASLTRKLRDHLAALPAGPSGVAAPDAQAVEAARSILRYFEIAAPLHHADEEDDLYPALCALGQPPLAQAIGALNAEHGELDALWARLRPWLKAIAEGHPHAAPAEVDAFAERYTAHARGEEEAVYPAAAQLPAEQIKRIAD